MNVGQFIWADLSTYNTKKSCQFYQAVFGWEILDVNNYFLAQKGNSSITGIFETPDFLKKINMPHFWMSYFQVESTEKTVEIAKRLHAKVEIDTTEFNNGNIALIRDPQGAGFTIYDGKDLYLCKPSAHGSLIKTELHISNIESVIPFYCALFNWDMTLIDHDIYKVKAPNYESKVLLKQLDNSVKGNYEYWVTTIEVSNLDQCTQHIIDNKGSLILKENNRNLMADNSGEAFFYIQERQ